MPPFIGWKKNWTGSNWQTAAGASRKPAALLRWRIGAF
jgi:hypothetical protein